MEPRIPTPRNARSRRTRAAILDAAWRLVEEEGAAALSMVSVARGAGVTRAAVYLHFTSRGELLLALLKHVNTTFDLAGSIRPLREAPDALAALDAWAAHLARFHVRILPLTRAVERVRGEDPDAAELWRRAMADWHSACRDLMRRLDAEERLAAPWTEASAADLLWGMMSPELLERLTAGRGWSTEELAGRLALLVRRTFVVEPPLPT